MYEGFTPFDIAVQHSITIYGIRAGSGPPLLLLHGFPQSHHIWHRIAPKLIKDFTIVAIDLRGYGASSKPRGDDDHKLYAKSAMATDCIEVMAQLGFHQFFVCSHDRGARVAHKLCIDYPQAVRRVIILDICPTLAMYTKTNQDFATAYFHWFFLIQATPFPENVISHSPMDFAQRFFGRAAVDVFDPECLAYYVSMLANQETVHSMCEDYRASATVDLEEARGDIEANRHVNCPIRVLWGKKGVIEKTYDAVEEWKQVHASGRVDGQSVDCGHYIPEETPDVVINHIREFFVQRDICE